MKATTIHLASAMLIIACASVATMDPEAPPILENRTLKISKHVPGFEYQWRECTKRGIFGRCKETEMRVEYYDLSNAEMRDKLLNMGFVAKVREKLLP